MNKVFRFFNYILAQEIIVLYAYTIYAIYDIVMCG